MPSCRTREYRLVSVSFRFRFVLGYCRFVTFRLVSFRLDSGSGFGFCFVSFRFRVSLRFASFCVVFVSFRFTSFQIVPFRFCFRSDSFQFVSFHFVFFHSASLSVSFLFVSCICMWFRLFDFSAGVVSLHGISFRVDCVSGSCVASFRFFVSVTRQLHFVPLRFVPFHFVPFRAQILKASRQATKVASSNGRN